MLQNRKHYRKSLTSRGLIFMDGQELEISVCNLSITGLLAELEVSEGVKDIKDVFLNSILRYRPIPLAPPGLSINFDNTTPSAGININ